MACTILLLLRKILLLILYVCIIIGRGLHINNLPDEVLQEVFELVWFIDGDAAIALQQVEGTRWRSAVHDWEKAYTLSLENNIMLYMTYMTA